MRHVTQTSITHQYADHGARIRAARKRAGLSHDRLAALVGTSRSHLIKLEKGKHRAKPDMLGRIADATGTRVADLDPSDEDEEAAARMRQNADLFEVLAQRVAEIIDARGRTEVAA